VIADQIYSALEAKAEPPRAHLGASEIGHHCERWLWLKFRWAVIEKFPGRMLRLFRRGQQEEEYIIDDLKMIGLKVSGEQRRVEFFPHFSGSLDAVIYEKGSQIVVEMKTHSKKSFDDLEKKGVRKSKPQHYAQMLLYMKGINATKALYFAVCKDDDRIYTQTVDYDDTLANKLLDRARRIITSDHIPEPVSTDPTWYQCKMCAASHICHEGGHTKEVNCRTCAHHTFMADGLHCASWDYMVPVEYQREGCPRHVLHPDLVPWKLIPDESTSSTATFDVSGVKVKNGPEGIPSKEIISNPKAFGTTEGFVEILREKAGAEVVG